MRALGERVRHARKANRTDAGKRMTQAKLAKLVGLSQRAIAGIENGEVRNPPKFREIASALGMSVTWLLEGQGDIRKLSHLDEQGAARMVDVSAKPATERVAVAEGRVVMSQTTLDLVLSGNAKKGDVLGAARIAGIMAAKRTHELIPLCHPLMLSKTEVDISADPKLPGLTVRATVKVTGQTGVEMEALTAVSVACLTIYDMVKAVERSMKIEGIRLIEKSGGASGDFRAI